jgi:hypothetical protein
MSQHAPNVCKGRLKRRSRHLIRRDYPAVDFRRRGEHLDSIDLQHRRPSIPALPDVVASLRTAALWLGVVHDMGSTNTRAMGIAAIHPLAQPERIGEQWRALPAALQDLDKPISGASFGSSSLDEEHLHCFAGVETAPHATRRLR